MKRILVLFIVLSVLILASCKATVMSPGEEIVLRPTAKPLVGDFPVGRWACFKPFSYERVKRTNSIRELPRCAPWYYGVVELRPDDVGWWLNRNRNELKGSVRFKNDTTHFYTYPARGEIRWRLTGTELLMQSAYNYRYQLTEITDEVFGLSANASNYLMINIESDSYVAIQVLAACVEANSKRKLFQLETCPRPPWVSE